MDQPSDEPPQSLPPDAAIPGPLAEEASAIGEAWVHDYVRELDSQSRAASGAWPGTLTEARRRVVIRIRSLTVGASDTKLIDQLARVANLAARRAWQQVCVPDLEA